MAQNELSHYGVLGMKWGKSKNSNSTKQRKERTHEEQTKHKVRVAMGKEIVADLFGAGVGALSARALLSQTDVAMSETAMYVGTMLGGFMGAMAVDSLFD